MLKAEKQWIPKTRTEIFPTCLPRTAPFRLETLEGQLAALAAERDQLAAEKADLQDRLLRARAEFDNARRRAERERSDFLQFAAMDLVRDILPVLDDFERALKVETADRDYAKGVELIYQRLFETLKKLGLEPIETAGAAVRSQPAPGRGARADRGGRRPGRFWASSSEAIISKASFSGPPW